MTGQYNRLLAPLFPSKRNLHHQKRGKNFFPKDFTFAFHFHNFNATQALQLIFNFPHGRIRKYFKRKNFPRIFLFQTVRKGFSVHQARVADSTTFSSRLDQRGVICTFIRCRRSFFSPAFGIVMTTRLAKGKFVRRELRRESKSVNAKL